MFGRDTRRERQAVSIIVAPRRLPIAMFMALSLVFMMLDEAEANAFDRARDAITDFTSPIFEALSPPIEAVRDFFGGAFRIFDIYDENDRLRAENLELLAWKDEALRLKRQNERYEALLNVNVPQEAEFVTARVVTEAGAPFKRTFIVNAGSRDGVKNDQAVVDEIGVVGRIFGTGRTASRVLMLSDLNSRVPVVIEPSSYRAVLSGDNRAQPKLEFLPKSAQLRVGDRVVTSGHGGVMPPGLPVGVISKVSGDEIRVQPYSRNARVEHVRILNYSFPRQVDAEVAVTDETENE